MSKDSPPDEYGLTQSQRRFLEVYDGSIPKAAKDAGVTSMQVGRWMKENSAFAAQLYIRDELVDTAIIANRRERQQFLSAIMRSEHEKTNDRLKACEHLCRIAGDFIQKLEISSDENMAQMIIEARRNAANAMKRDIIDTDGVVIDRPRLAQASHN